MAQDELNFKYCTVVISLEVVVDRCFFVNGRVGDNCVDGSVTSFLLIC